MTTGTVDLANSIYIDWGTFINAVINFLIIAFVVFSMVKLINKFKELTDFTENMKKSSKRNWTQTKNLLP